MDKNYFRVHAWLNYWYGRATRCENKQCVFPNPKRYEWALRPGKKYEKNRENFMQLCPSCHRKQDYKPEFGEKISKALKGKIPINRRPVILNGKVRYKSMTYAAEMTGTSITSIANNLAGRSATTKAGKWEYDQKN